MSMWASDSVAAKSSSDIFQTPEETSLTYRFLENPNKKICEELETLIVENSNNSTMQDTICIFPSDPPPDQLFKTPTNPQYPVTLTTDLCAYWTSIAQLVTAPRPPGKSGIFTMKFQKIEVRLPRFCLFESPDAKSNAAVVRRRDTHTTTVRLSQLV